MRIVTCLPLLALAVFALGSMTNQGNAGQTSKHRAQCAGFGFQEGTDAFANCMMQLSLRQQRDQPPDHGTVVQRYRDLSMRRQGDERYPVCSAANMDAELDTSINKWVGPNCQLAPD